MASESPGRQRNAVSQGMALGLLMCDRDVLPRDKIITDLAFESEFPRWRYSNRFPQVVTDLRNGLDGYIAITHADERKHVWHLFWSDQGWPPSIHARPRWDDEEIDPVEVADGIGGGVPAEGWRELAEAFLSHFNLVADG